MENSTDCSDNYRKSDSYQDGYITASCKTLNDNMTDTPIVEYISTFCVKCREYFYYGDVVLHRRLHVCLDFLQINSFEGLTFKSLAKRRNKFMKHLKSYTEMDRLCILTQLDAAYVTVYNYLIGDKHIEVQLRHFEEEDNFPHKYGPKGNQLQCARICSLLFDTVSNFDVASGIYSRSKNEEACIIAENISEYEVFFAIVTAVDGNCAKKYVSENLFPSFNTNYKSCNDIDRLSNVIECTLVDIDKKLSTGIHDDVTYKSWSGCCLELIVISKMPDDSYRITVSNVGDGTVVLIQNNSFKVLSTLHSMKNESEVRRIERLGGKNVVIDSESYLNGTTQITQLLGGYGDNKRKQYQMPNLKCFSSELDLDNDIGIIMLNRELSQVITLEDAVEIFRSETADHAPLPSNNEVSTGIFDELINDDMLKVPYDHVTCTALEETKSRIIVRKLVHASALCSNYGRDIGALAFVFNKSEKDPSDE